MANMPCCLKAFPTDLVRPVGLTRDPFPEKPGFECKKRDMNQTRHIFKICIVGSTSDQSHERCSVVNKPDSSSTTKCAGSWKQGVQNLKKFQLSNLTISWFPEVIHYLWVWLRQMLLAAGLDHHARSQGNLLYLGQGFPMLRLMLLGIEGQSMGPLQSVWMALWQW